MPRKGYKPTLSKEAVRIIASRDNWDWPSVDKLARELNVSPKAIISKVLNLGLDYERATHKQPTLTEKQVELISSRSDWDSESVRLFAVSEGLNQAAVVQKIHALGLRYTRKPRYERIGKLTARELAEEIGQLIGTDVRKLVHGNRDALLAVRNYLIERNER